jgi:hypothetical protein
LLFKQFIQDLENIYWHNKDYDTRPRH